ncbi:hypothetical protein Hanom_Chr10g00878151 [Helianthus anomalus]
MQNHLQVHTSCKFYFFCNHFLMRAKKCNRTCTSVVKIGINQRLIGNRKFTD